MNPITSNTVSVDRWNEAMEKRLPWHQVKTIYSNAGGGQIKNCGTKPLNIHISKAGKRNYQANLDSWNKCVDEVRQMNVANGMNPNTGLDSGTGGTPPPPGNPPSGTPTVPDMTAKDSGASGSSGIGGKVILGLGIAGVLVATFFAVKHFHKGSAAIAAPKAA
jgi:hypothetical protein